MLQKKTTVKPFVRMFRGYMFFSYQLPNKCTLCVFIKVMDDWMDYEFNYCVSSPAGLTVMMCSGLRRHLAVTRLQVMAES